MNLLIGKLRKKFIQIIIAMTENESIEAEQQYYLLFKEIQKNLIPIRENRKNERNKYKIKNTIPKLCFFVLFILNLMTLATLVGFFLIQAKPFFKCFCLNC